MKNLIFCVEKIQKLGKITSKYILKSHYDIVYYNSIIESPIYIYIYIYIYRNRLNYYTLI